jgi:hypothetical protein
MINSLDIIHRPKFLFKMTFRRLDFCLRPQVKACSIDPINRASPYLRTQKKHKTPYVKQPRQKPPARMKTIQREIGTSFIDWAQPAGFLPEDGDRI